MSEEAAQYDEEEVAIPSTAYTNCPLYGDRYPLVSILKYCAPCGHFQGFFKQKCVGQGVAFSREYSVRCGVPVSRSIVEVVN